MIPSFQSMGEGANVAILLPAKSYLSTEKKNVDRPSIKKKITESYDFAANIL
jgi:hypothetical protein